MAAFKQGDGQSMYYSSNAYLERCSVVIRYNTRPAVLSDVRHWERAASVPHPAVDVVKMDDERFSNELKCVYPSVAIAREVGIHLEGISWKTLGISQIKFVDDSCITDLKPYNEWRCIRELSSGRKDVRTIGRKREGDEANSNQEVKRGAGAAWEPPSLGVQMAEHTTPRTAIVPARARPSRDKAGGSVAAGTRNSSVNSTKSRRSIRSTQSVHEEKDEDDTESNKYLKNKLSDLLGKIEEEITSTKNVTTRGVTKKEQTVKLVELYEKRKELKTMQGEAAKYTFELDDEEADELLEIYE